MAMPDPDSVLPRVLMVLVDGLGDVSVPALGDRTPLEVAHTPILDAIAGRLYPYVGVCAAAGLNGLLDPVEPGLACGSDTAHMSLFGYDPRIHYRGRGAFESMGAGISMAPGDIAFKCNFATLDTGSGVVVRRRADRNFEHLGPELCQALDGLRLPNFPEHCVKCRYATEHRCGIAVSGPSLSDAVQGTDPLKDALPLLRCVPEDGSAEAAMTAELVNELSDEIRRVLEEHPVNQQRREQARHGMAAAMVAPTKIIAGR
ncbi:metalloenzyme domain-containing protein [Haematococcus lacustris]|uniref:Metalloenzyme domain-containing protein n=1 Tax=Haematococcus lacustris TaxID=44745 RepID=A0A699YG53_HAELA|nr:metalloenzyme domain-containing protein [Haematococcus lacustris]